MMVKIKSAGVKRRKPLKKKTNFGKLITARCTFLAFEKQNKNTKNYTFS